LTASGILGIISFFYLIKSIGDAILNFFQLKKIYGFSFYLLGAIFTSITNFLVQLSHFDKQQISLENPQTNLNTQQEETKFNVPLVNFDKNIQEVQINLRRPNIRSITPRPPPIPSHPPEIDFHDFEKN